jgi:hypothetical protein
MALTKTTLLDMYWHMLLARRLDERAWQLHKDGEINYHIPGIGHEALQVAAAFAIRRGEGRSCQYLYTPRSFSHKCAIIFMRLISPGKCFAFSRVRVV